MRTLQLPALAQHSENPMELAWRVLALTGSRSPERIEQMPGRQVTGRQVTAASRCLRSTACLQGMWTGLAPVTSHVFHGLGDHF